MDMNSSVDAEEVHYTLDVCGLFCPEPVMKLHSVIRQVLPGETIKIIATDPSTVRDIPKFCQFLNHELIVSEEQESQFIYYIKKGA